MIDENLIHDEFPALRDEIYLDTAAAGPTPRSARAGVDYAFDREQKPSLHDYAEWSQLPDDLRKKISDFSRFTESQISHHSSVGEIVSIVAQGFSLSSDDVVVCFESEYPSDVLPWMLAAESKGFRVERMASEIRYDLDELKKSLPSRTKVLNLSHVSFSSGKRANLLELGRLCRERDILFVVDLSQSLGSLQISDEERELIDVGACVTYKWLLGSYGNAFAYFSPSSCKKIQRTYANWMVSTLSKDTGSLTTYTLETLPEAKKFDRGQAPNPLVTRCLMGSLDLLMKVGPECIEKHNIDLQRYFLENINTDAYEMRCTPGESSIAVVVPKGKDALALYQKLRKAGVNLSLREGGLRLSFHLFNSKTQVQNLLELL